MKTSAPKISENTKCRNPLVLWGPVALYAGFLFWLSSLHHPRVPRFPYADKVYHVLLYSAFAFLVVRAAEPVRRHWGKVAVIACGVAGASLYGATDEFHQLFVTSRSAELADLAADALGGLMGGLFFLLIRYYAGKIRHQRKVPGNDQTLASL